MSLKLLFIYSIFLFYFHLYRYHPRLCSGLKCRKASKGAHVLRTFYFHFHNYLFIFILQLPCVYVIA